MTNVLLFLALATLALKLFTVPPALWGMRRLRRLRDVAPDLETLLPTVSIVLAARDEEVSIEAAITSMLAQDYPSLEVIAVDDRSHDETGRILDRIAATETRLRVVHVRELPAGWLGKNQALARGAEVSSGAFLPFTDADVILAPRTLRRAVTLILEQNLDHLTLGPRLEAPGVLLAGFVAYFLLFLTIFTQPWKARDLRSKRFIGLGAFNLVRADAYRRAGGHTRIAMRPDDDLMLGKLLKSAGARQDIALGESEVRVLWYPDLGAAIRGLEKNLFAGAGYRVGYTILGASSLVVLDTFPVAAVALTHGVAFWANVVAALVVPFGAVVSGRAAGLPWWAGLLAPLSALLLAFVFLRSMTLALRRGGIMWRGTLYPLSELRRHKL